MRHAARSCFVGTVLIIAGLLSAAPTVAQTTLVARSGDGVWSLLRRAGIPPDPGNVAAFRTLNEGRFTRRGGLLAGRAYRIPETQTRDVGRFPIFGPKYERVERKSDRLQGHVYYVVSGHGGPDPGTVGRHAGRALAEDEVAYDVALRLARRLIEEGATVHIIVQDPDDGIRDGSRFEPDRDERYLGDRPIALDQGRRLRDRTAIINRLYETHRGTARLQRVLALHVDARGTRHEPQIDVHFQVASDRAAHFADGLLSTFRQEYARVQPGRGYTGAVEHRDLYLLVHTKPVATLVELGNIRHPRDQLRLTRVVNRRALAEWLVRGLLRESAASTACAACDG